MNLWTSKAHQLRAHQARLLADIIRNINPDDPTAAERVYTTTLAGDERKLRGIPAIGRGVTGAIPGTSPDRLAS
jgi:hypothetical protein